MGGRGGSGGSVSLGNGLSIDGKTYNLARDVTRAEHALYGRNETGSQFTATVKYAISHQIAKGGAESVKSEFLRRKAVVDARKSGSTKAQPEKTFVNGFGEATKREIATSGYKAAQKKLSKQILKFVGGK